MHCYFTILSSSLYLCLSINLIIQFAFLSVSLPVYLSIYLFIYTSIQSSQCPLPDGVRAWPEHAPVRGITRQQAVPSHLHRHPWETKNIQVIVYIYYFLYIYLSMFINCVTGNKDTMSITTYISIYLSIILLICQSLYLYMYPSIFLYIPIYCIIVWVTVTTWPPSSWSSSSRRWSSAPTSSGNRVERKIGYKI